jgi:hypothetical protein
LQAQDRLRNAHVSFQAARDGGPPPRRLNGTKDVRLVDESEGFLWPTLGISRQFGSDGIDRRTVALRILLGNNQGNRQCDGNLNQPSNAADRFIRNFRLQLAKESRLHVYHAQDRLRLVDQRVHPPILLQCSHEMMGR